jgi:hypothetical protein
MGIGYAQIKDKAIQIGIKHIMDIFNKPTNRGPYLTHTKLE